METVYTKITTGIHRYLQDNKYDRVVVGVSGGLDSALVLKLAVDALTAKNVTAVMIPEKGVTSDENYAHAKVLCQFLKVEHFSVPLNRFLTDFLTLPWKPNNLSQINVKSRIRASILYSYSNSRSALVLGAANKSDMALGYGTKYGSFASDLNVLGDLYKTEVLELAKFVGLPTEFLEKVSSPELYVGHTDEDELGASYKEIDVVLDQMASGVTKETLINKGVPPHVVHKVFRLVELNSHKTSVVPIIKL